jgi:hypothetical protein
MLPAGSTVLIFFGVIPHSYCGCAAGNKYFESMFFERLRRSKNIDSK